MQEKYYEIIMNNATKVAKQLAADVLSFHKLASPLLTVWTYDIKEALTGIDGVQQLINVVLSGEQGGIRENRHTFVLKTSLTLSCCYIPEAK